MELLIAFHVIFIVCWFSGLFYLPRLFVYHVSCAEKVGQERFKIMEHKLYYYITTPSGVLTTFCGLLLWLPRYDYYANMNWLHAKLILVVFLWIYHISCGYYLYQLRHDKNTKTERFFRFFNEVPVLILVPVVILSFVKP